MAIVHNPQTVHPPVGAYSHGIEVPPNARWLYVAGQIALSPDGADAKHPKVPTDFEEQCRLAWTNLRNVLRSAGMDIKDLVKLTIFMVRESDLPAFRKVRDQFLEGWHPATTLVFVRALARPEWLIEIEGVAASP